MADALYVDTVDMRTLGLVTESVRGHRDAPRKNWPTRSVPGAIAKAAVAMSTQPEWEPRTVDVFGVVVGTDHADMLANRGLLEAAIHTPATVDVSFVDDLTIKLVCRCIRFEVEDIQPGFINRGASIRIQLIAFDPQWVAV